MMEVQFLCGTKKVIIKVPDDARVFRSSFPESTLSARELVLGSIAEPLGARPLREGLRRRAEGEVVVVVSDITRVIPYREFLPELLGEVEAAGVPRREITILIATGMHRASSEDERREMFGDEVASSYRIIDHDARSGEGLVELEGLSFSGSRVKLNRRFLDASFKIITGLVEPHFMAGFSGGRKAVCPGLASLETVRRFHGFEFLSNPRAAGGVLDGNPCHQEALSVARMAGVDFSINVVIDNSRRVVAAFAGSLEPAHDAARELVAACACPEVGSPADLVVTSSGGYPLDATFYQCVKGMVSCLPAVKNGGAIVSFGGCVEGVGSGEYAKLMADYSDDWRRFLRDAAEEGFFVRDQWEFQMQCRALERVGRENLIFATPGLDARTLSTLSVNGIAADERRIESLVQGSVDGRLEAGMTVAVFPEGPYCAPAPCL